MRLLLVILSIVASLQIVSPAQETKNILFVGNSLTYWNSLNNPDFPYCNPMLGILQKMFDEKKMNINIEKATNGSTTLAIHATYLGTDDPNEIFRRATQGEVPATIKKILSKHWDIVVLQESLNDVLNPGKRYYTTEPALMRLDSLIKQVHGKTVLYQAYSEPDPGKTYIIHSGQKFPRTHYLKLDTFGHMFDFFAFDPSQMPKITGADTTFYDDSFQNTAEEFHKLQIEYNTLAAKINAGIVEVGLAFEKCKRQYPEIHLYIESDESDNNIHPSMQGAYLIACMFYKYITGQSLDSVKYHADLNEDEAKKLRRVAESIHPKKNNSLK